MKNKYPIYIVSKGRAYNPITAKLFMDNKIDFKICIEPQEYEEYAQKIPEKNILKTDFSNLGMGSTPARNFIWMNSIKNRYDRHFIFDDNIYHFRRVNKGKRTVIEPMEALVMLETFTDRYKNVGVSGFNL